MPTSLPTPARIALRVAFSGVLAIGILSTAPTAKAHAATRHHASAAKRVLHAANIAANQKGDRYAYGTAGPNRFDCSGLTYFSYRKAGFRHMPRTSRAQAHFTKHIKRSKMKRGDLMFFFDGGGVYHVGVFAGSAHGHRLVLHAPYSGTRVRTERVWTKRWFPGTLRHR
jgi:cell wall-associated NlpC family hydrolase